MSTHRGEDTRFQWFLLGILTVCVQFQIPFTIRQDLWLSAINITIALLAAGALLIATRKRPK